VNGRNKAAGCEVTDGMKALYPRGKRTLGRPLNRRHGMRVHTPPNRMMMVMMVMIRVTGRNKKKKFQY
jgi:hypothetical protein